MENPDPRKVAPATAVPLDLASKLLILRHAAQRVVAVATGKRLDGKRAKEGELEAAIEILDNRLRQTATESVDGLYAAADAYLCAYETYEALSERHLIDQYDVQLERDLTDIEMVCQKGRERIKACLNAIDQLNGEPQ